MSQKQRALTAAALAAAFLAGTLAASILPDSTAFAAPLSGGRPVLQRLAERLELTPEQRAEVRSILRAHAPQLGAGFEQVRQERSALFAAIHQHPPVEAEIRTAAARVAEVEADLAVGRSQLADELYGVLTPDQQEELAEIKADARALLETWAGRFRASFQEEIGA